MRKLLIALALLSGPAFAEPQFELNNEFTKVVVGTIGGWGETEVGRFVYECADHMRCGNQSYTELLIRRKGTTTDLGHILWKEYKVGGDVIDINIDNGSLSVVFLGYGNVYRKVVLEAPSYKTYRIVSDEECADSSC